MVPHAGTDSQVWRNTVELGRALAALAPVRGSRVRSRAALVFDYPTWWAIELDSHPNNTLAYADLVLEWYKAAWYEGIGVDIVAPDADLSGYDLVVAPNLYLTEAATAANLGGVTARGGVFATTWFSGIVDASDHVHLGGYPGAFRDLLGVRVEEFHPLQVGETRGVRLGEVDTVGERWSEQVELRGARARGTLTDGVLAGGPIVTENEVGDGGRAWYVATDLPLDAKRVLVRTWADQAGVAPVLPGLPEGVEAVRRTGDGESFLFLFNHTDEPARVPASGTELLVGAQLPGGWELPAGAVAVLRETTGS
ncbi:beta-galactosidase [Propioniciclava coleopterorum]|uniref:beta-galactosidase n=1 Tax=Propioniciclava coleopterorum TaxID=2714937 RepID=UPI003D7074BF